MICKKKISSINDLQQIQRLAVESPGAVTLVSKEGTMRVDAKSYIGMYALDFSQPVTIESDDADYMGKIHDIGENV